VLKLRKTHFLAKNGQKSHFSAKFGVILVKKWQKIKNKKFAAVKS
jgi:hypothetical protein